MELKRFTAGRGAAHLVRDFVRLGERLYTKQTRTQMRSEMEELLEARHPLSGHFDLEAMLIYRARRAVARACLIHYPAEDVAYFGFFEAGDEEAAHHLMDALEAAATRPRLIGPLNGSFWIGYRMRLPDARPRPFTGEPWNQGWYPGFFEGRGYRIRDRYISQHFGPSLAQLTEPPPRLKRRLARAEALGYELRNPRPEEWDQGLTDVAGLIVELYRDFPLYQRIDLATFRQLFAPLRRILDLRFVDFAYRDGELCAFSIGLPDYGSLPFRRLTPLTLLRILWRRRHAKHISFLYMGVALAHVGLAQALLCRQVERIIERGASCTAALIHEGRVTAGFGAQFIDETSQYVLFEKQLEGEA